MLLDERLALPLALLPLALEVVLGYIVVDLLDLFLCAVSFPAPALLLCGVGSREGRVGEDREERGAEGSECLGWAAGARDPGERDQQSASWAKHFYVGDVVGDREAIG